MLVERPQTHPHVHQGAGKSLLLKSDTRGNADKTATGLPMCYIVWGRYIEHWCSQAMQVCMLVLMIWPRRSPKAVTTHADIVFVPMLLQSGLVHISALHINRTIWCCGKDLGQCDSIDEELKLHSMPRPPQSNVLYYMQREEEAMLCWGFRRWWAQ